MIEGFVDTCSDLTDLFSTIISTIQEATFGGEGVVQTIGTKVEGALSAALVPIIKFVAAIVNFKELPATIKKLMEELKEQARNHWRHSSSWSWTD